MTKFTALIAGATGAAAARLVDILLEDDNWSVIGLCRNPPDVRNSRLRYISVNLLDAAAVRNKLAGERNISHLFYTSRAPFKEGGVEDVDGNIAMLRNALDAVELASTCLQHVHLVEGAKWYGIHLGPGPAPAREDAPRHIPPNFYYDQQDFLAERQSGSDWTWSACRPNIIYDFAPDRARNIVSVLGVWAAMHKELGLPLDFPGSAATYQALYDMTDARHLARAMKWMATSDQAHNEAFNVTDGDVFRWHAMWKRLANHFNIEVGTVRQLSVGHWMADKQPLWDRIVARHGLVQPDMAKLAPWEFLDFILAQNFDVFSIMTKIRVAGFHDTIRTEDQLLNHLKRYQEAKLIPQ
ncbi:MAG: SDR family oxidoreductase [Hyphomicrobiaceae bacterium]